jgi:hypothetical protein
MLKVGFPPGVEAHLQHNQEGRVKGVGSKYRPQSHPGFAGVDPRLAQPLTDQVVVAPGDLLQNSKHQIVSELLQPEDNPSLRVNPQLQV